MSSLSQLEEALAVLDRTDFSAAETERIDAVLAGSAPAG